MLKPTAKEKHCKFHALCHSITITFTRMACVPDLFAVFSLMKTNETQTKFNENNFSCVSFAMLCEFLLLSLSSLVVCRSSLVTDPIFCLFVRLHFSVYHAIRLFPFVRLFLCGISFSFIFSFSVTKMKKRHISFVMCKISFIANIETDKVNDDFELIDQE